MADIWSKFVGTSELSGLDYWDFFGVRLVERAAIAPGFDILDVGCGTGSSLFPARRKTGAQGKVVGIDICDH